MPFWRYKYPVGNQKCKIGWKTGYYEVDIEEDIAGMASDNGGNVIDKRLPFCVNSIYLLGANRLDRSSRALLEG
jgi:hypothetical protein